MNMNYKKKYIEALDRARDYAEGQNPPAMDKELLSEIFPELKESEDERIRKVIYKLILGMRKEIFTAQDDIVTKDRVIAWLEKQKELKPSEEQMTALKEAIMYFGDVWLSCRQQVLESLYNDLKKRM